MIRGKTLLTKQISSEPFLSGYTYRTIATQAICDSGDTVYMKESCDGIDPSKVSQGDILYVTGNRAKHFFVNIAPKIEQTFSVITAQTDYGVDSTFLDLLPDNLLCWWSINVHVKHPKVKPIPLGLQNLHWKIDNNVQSDPRTFEKNKTNHKPNLVLASFSIFNNVAERLQCLSNGEKIGATIRNFTKQDRENYDFVGDYFKQASSHRFILCPWGAGVDTHRLWETMYLGSIPITRRHTVYSEFYDYPILFLDDWSELTSLKLDDLYEQYRNKLDNEERIYFPHWRNKICHS